MQRKTMILVVDDDPDLLDATRIILERHGYEVRTASDGKEAMASLKEKQPDLMILDVMMTSETEGFEIAFALREQPEYRNIPIILLTSFLEKVRDVGPGSFEYILGEQWPAQWLFEKPLDKDKLIAKIEEILAEQV